MQEITDIENCIHNKIKILCTKIDRLTAENEAKENLLNKIYNNYTFHLYPEIKKEIKQVLKGKIKNAPRT